jgi:3-deoxy-D-manno-oct-2-ulosonic acid (Kdo) hydroxylase
MGAELTHLDDPVPIDPNSPPDVRLERGEVVVFSASPFELPTGDDADFLLAQTLASRAHKNISYDPNSGRSAGFARRSRGQAQRLTRLLADFARNATDWLAQLLPRYATAWKLDRVSYRPLEESTRRLRWKARNDLLHVDAFPSRPSHGCRILRLFVNLNPSEPRVWATSYPFGELLRRYGAAAGLPDRRPPFVGQFKKSMLRIFKPNRQKRSEYDQFMLRFHDHLKGNAEFQEREPKCTWKFPPGSVWLAMTDTCSHSVLSGRYALEHSYFISPETQALAEESPAALLERACGRPVLRTAA